MSEQLYAWKDIEPDLVGPVFETAQELVTEGKRLHINLAMAEIEYGKGEKPEAKDKDSELLTLAAEGIAEDEQQLSMQMQEFGKSDSADRVYGAIGHFLLANSQNVGRIDERLTTLQQQYAAKASQLEEKTEDLRQRWEKQRMVEMEAELERFSRISPNAIDDVRRELLGRKGQFNPQLSPSIQALEAELLRLIENIDHEQKVQETFAKRRAMLDELVKQGGEAWPISIAERFRPAEKVQIELDELPVEPVLSERGASILAAMRDRHIDEPDASQFITLYLIEHANEVVNVKDLAQFLYNDVIRTDISETGLRSRITTLLGPARNFIGKLLEEEGYVLHYGWRRTLEKTPGKIKLVGGAQRIYRAMSKQDAEALQSGSYETEDETGTYRDNFVIERRSETADATEATEPAEANRPEQQGWVKAFRQQIGSAITQLEGLGLLNTRDKMPLRFVRTAYGNSRRTTDTGLEKLINADLLDQLKGIQEDEWGHADVSPTDLVVIEIFNPQKGPLRKDNHNRNRALAIKFIEEALEAYFSKKESQQ
jgi:hypothetical protein